MKHLIVFLFVWLTITVFLLDFYEYAIGIYLVSSVCILFGLVLTLVHMLQKSSVKIYLWLLYIGYIGLFAAYSEAIISSIQTQQSIQKSIVLIEALTQYKKDNGHYPKILDELKGQYLQDIPVTDIGIFTTEPYLYSISENTFRIFFKAHSLDIGGAYIYDSTNPRWRYDD